MEALVRHAARQHADEVIAQLERNTHRALIAEHEMLVHGGDPEVMVQRPDHHIGAVLEDGLQAGRLFADQVLGLFLLGDLVTNAKDLLNRSIRLEHRAEEDLIADAFTLCGWKFLSASRYDYAHPPTGI